MPEFDLSPSMIICAVAGAVLGFVLAVWGTWEVPIIISVTVVFGVLSGLFGLFVPWYNLDDLDAQCGAFD